MSKSMWIATEGQNLPVRNNDKPNYSIRVLFWEEGDPSPAWGIYNYGKRHWEATYLGETDNVPASQVKYFAYIDNPYK